MEISILQINCIEFEASTMTNCDFVKVLICSFCWTYGGWDFVKALTYYLNKFLASLN